MLRVHLAKRLSSVARLARGRVGGRSATTAIAALPAHVARRLANTRSVRRSLGTNRCVSRAFSTKATKAAEVSVEEVYEKKTPIEHVLLRPGMYIGSVEQTEQPMWVLAESAALESESAAAASSGAASGVSEPMDRHFERKVVTYNPGLYKLFDEILVNAIDNHARDSRPRESTWSCRKPAAVRPLSRCATTDAASRCSSTRGSRCTYPRWCLASC